MKKIICILTLLLAFLIVKVSAQNYNTLCTTGLALENEGKLDAAINKYSDAIGLKTNLSKGYSLRANAYFKKGNYDNAISDISQAIILSPNDNSLFEVRANCYMEKEVYDKALSDYNIVLSKANKNDIKYILIFFRRGKALHYNKRYDDAVVDYTQAIKLSLKSTTNYKYFYLWRALSYFKANNYTEAIKDFDTHLAVYPTYVKSIFYQGYAYNKNGETEKAKANALKLIEIDPSKEVYFSGKNILDIYDLDMRRKVVNQSLKEAITKIEESQISPSKTLANTNLVEAFTKLNKAWLYSTGISTKVYGSGKYCRN